MQDGKTHLKYWKASESLFKGMFFVIIIFIYDFR